MSNEQDIAAIEARANAATPGPWGWRGNVDAHWFALVTKHSGMRYVMTFDRFGMQSAQPVFQDYSDGQGLLVQAKELAIYQVAPEATSRHDPRFNVYRADIIGFRNPDADFIAHAREDIDVLLHRVRELEARLTEQRIAELAGLPAREDR